MTTTFTMNIQQYFEEKEQREKEKEAEMQKAMQLSAASPKQEEASIVIPVVQEEATIQTHQQDTANIKVQKKVVEVEKQINVPLLQEGYSVEHVPINQFIDHTPPIRQEGDRIIVPVVREVLVVEKRLELVEEVHLIKTTTTTQHRERVTLKKEELTVERTPADNYKG